MIFQFESVMTAGSAGGMFSPYKGLLPATPKGVLNDSPIAGFLLTGPKGPFSLL